MLHCDQIDENKVIRTRFGVILRLLARPSYFEIGVSQ